MMRHLSGSLSLRSDREHRHREAIAQLLDGGLGVSPSTASFSGRFVVGCVGA